MVVLGVIMTFKGTPGPWKYTVRNANEIMTTFHGVTIGNIYLDITTDNQKADSYLIAAAPGLLEALIELRKLVSHHDQADAAINKALGRE